MFDEADSLLLSVRTDNHLSTLPQKFSGHYAEYQVPVKLQALVLTIWNLHKKLNNEKYWLYFTNISVTLKEYLAILLNNDTANMDVRLANLSGAIQTALNTIIELKRANSNQAEFLNMTLIARRALDDLKPAFTTALAGKQNRILHPPPKNLTATSADTEQLGCLSPTHLNDFIEQIGAEPPTEPFYEIFSHAYFHMKKSSITAISFFAFALSAGIQSAFDYAIMDVTEDPNKSSNPSLYYFVHTVLPVLALSATVGLAIYAITETKKFRAERRKEHAEEVRKVKGIDNKSLDSAASAATLDVSFFESPRSNIPATVIEIPAPYQNSIPKFFGNPEASSDKPLGIRARCAFQFLKASVQHGQKIDTAYNEEHLEAHSAIELFLRNGHNTPQQREMRAFMEEQFSSRRVHYS